MNTSNIIVRLDAEHHAAEIEVRISKDSRRPVGLENALRRIGLRPMRTIELSTPRHFVTRTKVAKLDGFELNAARVAKALLAVRELETPSPRPLRRAA
ncbi:MAG TPA: hypothetical protein VKP30_17815 [Polyangiaceae bacterium]|nr:hypothetical protein [Polyangiaceae bacterium]